MEAVGLTVGLCNSILAQLFIAKHNKKECQSLQNAVAIIKEFVETLEGDTVGLSRVGVTTLGEHQCGQSAKLIMVARDWCKVKEPMLQSI
jgi:hypothetical protein